MVENYMKDIKESVYHGDVVSVLAVGYTMLGKTLIKMSPPSHSTFDIEDGVKLVGIIALSDFTKDYLIKQKITPNNKASAATKTNPFNICPGIICSCGKMCKESRGLKIHQAKTKCQMPENTLKAPPKKCFVSLNDVILSSCLSFEDKIY